MGEERETEGGFCCLFLKKTAAAVGTLLFGWVAVHLSDDFGKNFIDVHLVPSRGFDKRAVPGLGQCQSFHCGHFTLVLQVDFITDKK